MPRNLKLSIGLLAVFAAVVGALVLFGGSDEPTTASAPAPAERAAAAASGDEPRVVLPDDDARILGTPGESGVVFTEFLDFECESCLAVFPLIEQLREEYEGRATFALRYFPAAPEAHFNAVNAAVAVEAAAQQGALEAMYKRMYETAERWSHRRTSTAGFFRRLASELELDMEAYDAAVADPATEERVLADRTEGLALGVQGTPTFYVGEEQLAPEEPDDLRRAIDAALAAR